jgi:hypothetical protein
MKLFKIGLRIWIMLTSVLSFLAGWIMLAHAPKPVQNSSPSSANIAPLPTLSPLPDLGSGNNQNSWNLFQNSPLSVQPQVQQPVQPSIQPFNNSAPMPRLHTGGS